MNGKTVLPQKETIERKWHYIDADGKILGRLATEVADLLRGKSKTYYTNHLDCGDFVVITNAEKIKLTGKKLEQKIDFRYSGFPGGGTYTPYAEMMKNKPQEAFMLAVSGMLPKNK